MFEEHKAIFNSLPKNINVGMQIFNIFDFTKFYFKDNPTELREILKCYRPFYIKEMLEVEWKAMIENDIPKKDTGIDESSPIDEKAIEKAKELILKAVKSRKVPKKDPIMDKNTKPSSKEEMKELILKALKLVNLPP